MPTASTSNDNNVTVTRNKNNSNDIQIGLRNEKTVIYLILNLKTLLKDIKTLYKDILDDFHNDDEGYPDKVDNENELKFYKVKNLKTSESNEDLKFDLIEDDDQSLLELGLKDLDLLFVGTKYSIKAKLPTFEQDNEEE